MRKSIILAIASAIAAGSSVQAQEGGDAPPERGPQRPSFFARFDADGDGKVTPEELVAPAKKLIEAADKDGDGLLTEEELRDGRSQEQFAQLDGDKDGQLTLAEFQPAAAGRGFGRRGGRGGRGGMGMMGRDEDGDGKFSLDELTAFQKQLFEQADADQSGVLEGEELNARMGGRGRRGGEGQPPSGDGGEGRAPGQDQGGEGQPPRGEGRRGGRRGGGEGGGWGRGGQEPVKAEDLFAELDGDKSGGLSPEEFKQLAAARQKLAEAQRIY